jgi:D-serine dehydratase
MTDKKAPDAAPAFDAEIATAELAALTRVPLVPTDKGFTGVTTPATPQSLVGQTLASPALSTPSLVLRDSAIANNVTQLADWAARNSVLLAPHAKTTMSPELFTRQLAAGAWALTAANVTQAEVFARFGARRILIANEVADAVSIRALVGLRDRAPGLEICVYVDSEEGVALLDEHLRGAVDRLPVLVELGTPGGRAGARTQDAALAVARAASATSTLSVVGAACFEGVIGGGTDDGTLDQVRGYLARVRELGEAIEAEGLLGGGFGSSPDAASLILSAGGSHYFDLVAEEFGRAPARVVVRSGSYVVHDHGTYLTSTPSLRAPGQPKFIPAIEVRATVLSRPEPELAILGVGRRDVSFDSGMPVVLSANRAGAEVDTATANVFDLNDQHAFVSVPTGSELAVGDTVVLGISHPCTTLDKWPHAVVTDDSDTIVGVAHSFF